MNESSDKSKITRKVVEMWKREGRSSHNRMALFPSEWDELCDLAINGLTSATREPIKRGDRVVVTFLSGYSEEGTVEEATIWVRDATGHSYECKLDQIKLVRPEASER